MQLVIDSYGRGDGRCYDFYEENPAEYERGHFNGIYIAENIPEKYFEAIRTAIEAKFFELYPTGDIIYKTSK